MPQARKPPRLMLRTEAARDGGKRVWIIKNDGRHIRTGCLAHQIEDAERKFAEYLAGRYEPPRSGRSSEVTVCDVLTVYATDRAHLTAAPHTTTQIIDRLNDYFGAMPVLAIRASTCNDFAARRGTESGARRDLEVLRAAVKYYHTQHPLDVLPAFTLPGKSVPRERYLSRSEAAVLLWAAMGWEREGTGQNARWKRRRDQKRMHLGRLILIGLYTGTRPGAIKRLQWIRSTTGGWADVARGVIFRRADGERVAHNKRKTPVKMAPRLLAHMRRWKRLDGWADDRGGLRYVVHYQAHPIIKENKAFRSAVASAGLTKEVTPHVLRHTRGTWLAQAGVESGQAAASLGLTVEEYERTYLHNDPDFQQEAAEAY